MIANSSKYVTVTTFANAIEVSERTVRDWAEKGRLKAFRAGRAWRIERAEIERVRRGDPPSQSAA